MSAVLTSARVNDQLVTYGKAWRIQEFGGPEVIRCESQEALRPGDGEVLVRVKAGGVGPWDGWIRAGKSAVPQPLPLTLYSMQTSRSCHPFVIARKYSHPLRMVIGPGGLDEG